MPSGCSLAWRPTPRAWKRISGAWPLERTLMADVPDSLRVDKWLWTARFYKTRSLAAQAVEAGRARVNGERVKPARVLKRGDGVLVRSGELEWKVEVRGFSARRGPASEAALLYAESEESRARREAMILMR